MKSKIRIAECLAASMHFFWWSIIVAIAATCICISFLNDKRLDLPEEIQNAIFNPPWTISFYTAAADYSQIPE